MLTSENLNIIVQRGIELTTEKDKNKLFDKLLASAMDIASCDAGTLYLYRNGALNFKIMKTFSQGVSKGENGEEIDLPPVSLSEENICAYSAIHRELINIPDVYSSDRFDFSGPKRYDSITGFKTRSMLVIPLEDSESELIGVLQLINKLDSDGNCIAFSDDDEFILKALGSMTAVALSNTIYLEELKEQMFSFVQAFATAVDERTPYNGSHTRHVTIYANLLALYINKLHSEGKTEDYFDKDRMEQLILSAALHDIGKMVIPLSVMNKATRLEEHMGEIENRFELLGVLYERDMLKGLITESELSGIKNYLTGSLEFIKASNSAGFMTDDSIKRVEEIASRSYKYEDRRVLKYLTDEERDYLLVRKGTLTPGERKIMESHVVMTGKILEKVHFNKKYGDVTKFASSHHEYLNGTGYPNRLKGDDLPLETRILTVVDVFDALTCTDRPYKKPIPRPQAFAILHDMAKDGQLDNSIVTFLEETLENISSEEIDRITAEDDWCKVHEYNKQEYT